MGSAKAAKGYGVDIRGLWCGCYGDCVDARYMVWMLRGMVWMIRDDMGAGWVRPQEQTWGGLPIYKCACARA